MGPLVSRTQRYVLFLLLSVPLLPGHSEAARPETPRRPPAPAGARVTSADRWFDVNRMNLAVTNLGSLGFDVVNQDGGLFYPRESTLAVLFASGLWLGANVAGQPRLAIAEYSQEFRPGRVVSGVPENPAAPELVVWKVVRWSGSPEDTSHLVRTPSHPFEDPLAHHSWSEYMAGAVPRGAPWKLHRLPVTWTPDPTDSVDVPGPDVAGDQMTWCVFNDADPTAHQSDNGLTLPLGAEVQQTVFGFDDPGPLGDVAFVHWRVRNASGTTWSGLRPAYWADPDIGGSPGFTDDKVGADSARTMAVAYNGDAVDGGYGTAPPALGALLLPASPTPAPGDPPPFHAFAGFVNGTDPQNSGETFALLAGLSRDGTPRVDPIRDGPTRFHWGGDPLLGQGWLDPAGADKRFLAAGPPRDVAPGETYEFWVAIVIAPEPGVREAVAALRCRADVVRAAYASGFARPFPPVAPCPAPANCPRPAGYWLAQATGAGAYPPADLVRLATEVDRRSVPLDFGADPVAGFAAALGAGGDARLDALREHAAFLANVVAAERSLHPTGDAPVVLSPLTATACPGIVADGIGDLATPASTDRAPRGLYQNLVPTHRRALAGVNWGGSGFEGGVGSMHDFFGSTLNPVTQPDSFPALVRMRFSHTETQPAYRYLRLERASDGAPPPQGRGYLYAGYHPVPFTVRDEATGDPLAVAFVERALTDNAGTILPPAFQPASFDSTWGPNDAADGGREYLFVFRRPVTVGPVLPFAADGAVANDVLPGLFALWCRLRAAFDVIDDGDAFDFTFQYVFTPGADGLLRDLAGLPLSDPAVVTAYQQVTDCLGGVNRAETVGPTCDSPTPALVSLLTAVAEPGLVRVEWFVASTGAVRVERRVDDGEWLALATATPDGGHRVAVADRDVEAGHRYGYRLRTLQGPVGEVALDVPLRSVLSLAGLSPNPATGPLAVALSLASAAPARIEILDVAGRRVLQRPIDHPAPGSRRVPLEGVRLAPGVYVVRLEQSGARVTARCVVVR